MLIDRNNNVALTELEVRVKETLRIIGKHYLDLKVDSMFIKQLNNMFDTTYEISDVNYILGVIIEKQFNYTNKTEERCSTILKN